MENYNERNEKEIILEDFNWTMDKMDKYGGNKTQRLTDAVPSMPLLWIMAWESMEKGEPKFLWVHPL